MNDYDKLKLKGGMALHDLECAAEGFNPRGSPHDSLVIIRQGHIWRVGLGPFDRMKRVGTSRCSIALKTGRTFEETVQKVLDDPRNAECIFSREENILRGGDSHFDWILDSAVTPKWR